MTTPQTPQIVDEDEAIYELEKVLGARKDLEPDELALMQEALENLSLRQVVELIERQPSKLSLIHILTLPTIYSV